MNTIYGAVSILDISKLLYVIKQQIVQTNRIKLHFYGEAYSDQSKS